jgi:conserved oligomeric Golgi complex subunit 3
VQAFLRDEVQAFKPQPADLEYPQCLMSAQQSDGAANRGAQVGRSAPDAENVDGDDGIGDDTATWYPPLKSTLMCLSKLYNCVDPQAFSGLGQDALYNCTHVIQQAGALIEKKAGQKDAQLFTIRHLLILREQISSFQVDFRAYDRDLDFTHVRGQLQRLLSGEVPLFQASQTAASLQKVATGSLRVQENQVDGKKELEKALKTKCEAFIMSMTKLAVEPMLAFVTKVNALSQVGKVWRKCLD